MKLAVVGTLIVVLNLPFGYWRAKTKKYSFQWFMAVHLSVPLVYALRAFAGVEWHLITIPVLGGSFFLGQYLGGRFRQ
ncbi:MAG: hypothetical protein HUU54_12360 [Ignavibacteriaceae bacterium]|nr:hypothetical protein [Ignavibacteriaceae bacterium]